MINTIINSNLEIPLGDFTEPIEDVKSRLTFPNFEYSRIKKFGTEYQRNNNREPETLCFYKEKNGNAVLPRYFYGDVESNFVGEPLSDCNSGITLREYQKDYAENIDLSKTSFILNMPCGHGKTAMAIHFALKRGRKTLVVVPTYYLAEQWKDRLNQFSPNLSVSIFKSTTKKFEASDFNIIVMDLFSVRELPQDFTDKIGTCVIDEMHRLGAQIFLPILDAIPARYRIGLTATFRRQDGLEKLLKFHFGETYTLQNQFPKPKMYGIEFNPQIGKILTPGKLLPKIQELCDENKVPYEIAGEYFCAKSPMSNHLDIMEKNYYTAKMLSYTEHITLSKMLGKEANFTTIESFLSYSNGRFTLISTLIRRLLSEGRTILVLGKRIELLESLANRFPGQKPILITSRSKNYDKEYFNTKCRLIFGVMQLAKEGLDLDRLDTLVVINPISDLEQASGRISRLCEGKKEPRIFYIVDNHYLTLSTWKKAQKSEGVEYKYSITMDKYTEIQ